MILTQSKLLAPKLYVLKGNEHEIKILFEIRRLLLTAANTVSVIIICIVKEVVVAAGRCLCFLLLELQTMNIPRWCRHLLHCLRFTRTRQVFCQARFVHDVTSQDFSRWEWDESRHAVAGPTLNPGVTT